MSKRVKLEQLRQLSTLLLQKQESRLAQLLMRERDLQEAFLRLNQGAGGADPDKLEPSTRTGNTLNWTRWAEAQKIRINDELAQLRVQIEVERAAVAKEFGRKDTLSKLTQRLAKR